MGRYSPLGTRKLYHFFASTLYITNNVNCGTSKEGRHYYSKLKRTRRESVYGFISIPRDTFYFMGDVISQGKLQTKHVDKQLKEMGQKYW